MVIDINDITLQFTLILDKAAAAKSLHSRVHRLASAGAA